MYETQNDHDLSVSGREIPLRLPQKFVFFRISLDRKKSIFKKMYRYWSSNEIILYLIISFIYYQSQIYTNWTLAQCARNGRKKKVPAGKHNWNWSAGDRCELRVRASCVLNRKYLCWMRGRLHALFLIFCSKYIRLEFEAEFEASWPNFMHFSR